MQKLVLKRRSVFVASVVLTILSHVPTLSAQGTPSDEGGNRDPLVVLPSPAEATATDDPALARQAFDPAFTGMIALAEQGDSTLYLDKKNQLFILSDGISSRVLDNDSIRMGTKADDGTVVYADVDVASTVCEALVTAAFAAGCAYIATACVAGTFVSFGGFLIPCATVTAAACATSAAGTVFADQDCILAIESE
jgi:hypothetical protein